MPDKQQILFEDGRTIPWPENPKDEDYALLDSIELEIKETKSDVKAAIHPSVLRQIEKFGWESVLPTGGALAGAMVPGFQPVTIPAGALIGTYLNQQFGITEPDYLSLVLSAAVPGVVSPTKVGVKGFVKRTPAGHEVLNEIAIEKARSVPGKYIPTVPSEILFQKVGAIGTRFSNDKVMGAINTAFRKEIKLSTPNSDLINDLTRLKQKLIQNPNGLVAQDFHEESSRWYQNNKRAFTNSVPGSQHYGNVYNSFNDTMDDALKVKSTSPAALSLKNAINTYKSEKAIERMNEYVQAAIKLRTGTDYDTFTGKQVVQALKNDKNFQTAFTPEARKEIIDIYTKLNKIPKEMSLPIRAALGGTIGGIFGGGSPSENIFLGAIGFEVLNQAMTSKAGRYLVRELLESGNNSLEVKGLAILATYFTSQFNYNRDLQKKRRQPKLAKERGGRQAGEIPSLKLGTRLQEEE